MVLRDVDNPKSVNDRFGHQKGDHVPAEIASVIAKRTRSAIAYHDFGLTETITASLGVTAYASGEDLQRFIKRVDDAVYHAQAADRNTVTNV